MTVVNAKLGNAQPGNKPALGMQAPVVPRQPRPPIVEAMPGLGWSQAVELPRAVALAARPADARRAWVHHASEDQVLRLYRAACVGRRPPASPWWLRALADGTLPSRDTGFRVEDEVGAFLAGRAGWVYLPWANDGESGYWEYTPSERPAAGSPNPTTVLHTDRHTGWIDVLPAHDDTPPEPIAVSGPADLRGRIEEFEAVR